MASHVLRNIAIGALVIFGVRQFKLYRGLQFAIFRIDVRGSLRNPELDMTLSLDNPTGVAAELSSITGSLYSNGTYLAHVTYNTIQVIAPYNRTLVTVHIASDIRDVLSSVLAYLSQTQKTAVFQFRGNAVVNAIPVPVTMDYQFGQTT